jgi:hypothetical protein
VDDNIARSLFSVLDDFDCAHRKGVHAIHFGLRGSLPPARAFIDMLVAQ